MKILKIVLISLVSLAALIIIISFLLPSSFNVERSVTIKAPAEKIFPYCNSLKSWTVWTVWTKEADPTLDIKYEGPESGAGSKQTWTSKDLGNGTLEITESYPSSLVKFDMIFEGNFKSDAKLELTPIDGSTIVKWVSHGDLGSNPMLRYFGLFADKMMGSDYERGLAKLKKIVEDKMEQEKKQESLPSDSLGNVNP